MNPQKDRDYEDLFHTAIKKMDDFLEGYKNKIEGAKDTMTIARESRHLDGKIVNLINNFQRNCSEMEGYDQREKRLLSRQQEIIDILFKDVGL
ncbi:MAG: hypothetical protein ABIB79_00680 [archaeon]